MRNPIELIRRFVRRFDNVDRYTDGTWVYNRFSNPFSGSFFPDGRYVFHLPQGQIPFFEKMLAQRVRVGEVQAFKYAIRPLPTEEHPAIVVYSTNRKKENVKRVLSDLGIDECEWRGDNPISAASLCSETRSLTSVV